MNAVGSKRVIDQDPASFTANKVQKSLPSSLGTLVTSISPSSVNEIPSPLFASKDIQVVTVEKTSSSNVVTPEVLNNTETVVKVHKAASPIVNKKGYDLDKVMSILDRCIRKDDFYFKKRESFESADPIGPFFEEPFDMAIALINVGMEKQSTVNGNFILEDHPKLSQEVMKRFSDLSREEFRRISQEITEMLEDQQMFFDLLEMDYSIHPRDPIREHAESRLENLKRLQRLFQGCQVSEIDFNLLSEVFLRAFEEEFSCFS